MYRHDVLVSRYISNLYAYSFSINTHTDALTHTDRHIHCHVNRHVSSETREEKCKCSSLQVSDVSSVGRWICVCVRAKGSDLEREMVLIHYVFTVSPCPDALLCERTCLSGCENRWHSLRRMWRRQQALLCLLMFLISPSPLSCLFQRIVPLPRLSVEKNASYAAYSPFCQSPSFPSSSLQVPCCVSCIVRLQVVWELDLWEHMRAGETPWLTWLLIGRDGDKGRHDARTFRVAFAFPTLFCSKYILFISYTIYISGFGWFDIVKEGH